MSNKKVFEVNEVRLALLKSNPPILSVTAFGTVTTGGWQKAELIPYIYIQPPPDGIYDFDFVATPPEGIATQVITPIVANSTVPEISDGLNGVRVHASRNAQVALLGQSTVGGKTVCVKGKLTDEGVECQALRTANDELYTLVGDLQGFQYGDEVYVSGITAEFSFCMQGTTISVNWISKEPPKC